jgi:hypothetical protein
MKKIFFLAILFFGTLFMTFGQPNPTQKVHKVFLNYLKHKLPLTSQESIQMRPLVAKYFLELRNISKKNFDPLLKEQKRIELKIQYRNSFTPIIGQERANRFFVEEQVFRKKIREELKSRSQPEQE